MLNKKTLWGSLASLLLLASTSSAALAKIPASTPEPASKFQAIDQPLGLKIGVTIGGLAFIGLELWWFLVSQSPAHPAIPKLTEKK